MSNQVRITMTDVARRAGVSQSTVSYVLNDSKPISSEVRERVFAAVRDLDYTPDAAATALRGGRSRTLALSVSDAEGMRESWSATYLLQIALAARRQNHDLLVSVDAERPDVLVQIARSRRADGLALMSVVKDDLRVAACLAAGVPAVAIGRPAHDEIPYVDFDFGESTATAMRMLADNGHSRVVYVAPKRSESEAGYLYVDRLNVGMGEAARSARMNLTTFVPNGQREIDGASFVHHVRQTQPTAMVITGNAGTFDYLRSEFLAAIGEGDLVDAPGGPEPILILGATGLAEIDSTFGTSSRVIHPVVTLASASVHTLVEVVDGARPASRLVAPLTGFADRLRRH